MKFIEPKTVKPRILKFLLDAYTQMQINGDDKPRMLFTAMKYRLGYPHIAMAKRLGYMDSLGWCWIWKTKRPTKEMAELLHKKLIKFQRQQRQNRFVG